MEYRGNYEQANACQSYWQGNPYSDFYNGNPRNEPDFSWMRNDVRHPPYQPTYQQPYRSTYHPSFQPAYQEPYPPSFQSTYQDPYQIPYQPPNFQMPSFQQPPPYNPPPPNDEIAELKALMKQFLDSQIAFQECMNAPPIQPAVSENCEEYNYTRPNSILPDRVEDSALKNTPTIDRVKSYPVECPVLQPESVKLDRATCRASHTRSSNEKTDRVNAHESPNSENSNVTAITSKPEAKIVIRLPFPNRQRQARVEHQFDTTNTPSAIIDTLKATQNGDNVSEALVCLDSQVDEVDDRNAMVEMLEADLNGGELTSGQGETVSEVAHTSEAIEGQGKLKQTMLDVANEEERPGMVRKKASPEKNGTRRGTKRCWDPGGSFDKIRLVPWAWERDAGNRFGGANGRGKQDDYDDPGDERVTIQFVH